MILQFNTMSVYLADIRIVSAVNLFYLILSFLLPQVINNVANKPANGGGEGSSDAAEDLITRPRKDDAARNSATRGGFTRGGAGRNFYRGDARRGDFSRGRGMHRVSKFKSLKNVMLKQITSIKCLARESMSTLFQGSSYIKPLPANASAKEKFCHAQLLKHKRWASAMEVDRRMTEEFEEMLKVYL